MYNLIGKRFHILVFSGLAILVCIIALAVFGLKPGIEFSSGSMLTVRFEAAVDIKDLKQSLNEIGYPGAVVQSTGSGDFQIRISAISDEARYTLEDALQSKFGALTETGFTMIEPTISQQTVRVVIIALILAVAGILIYVTWAFRKMPKPFRFGVCGIAALAFDIIMAVGLFALIGGILHWEVNLMFITGLLSVVGYSINDKIVIFDRIRENSRKLSGVSFVDVVNTSVIETLTRSIITGVCTLFTIIALMLFVGSTIQNFLVVLLIGILAGTYSSIFISAPLLVVWENNEWKRFLPWVKSPLKEA
jgi:preprotein translocase subunit SecF